MLNHNIKYDKIHLVVFMRRDFIRSIFLRPIVLCLLFGTLIVLGVRWLGYRPLSNDQHQQVDLLVKASLPRQAEPVFEKLLVIQPQNMDLHYQYISNHFAIENTGKESRDDYHIMQEYLRLTEEPATADIGNYGSGLIRVNLKDFPEALRYYHRVQNVDLKYLNNSIGYIYLQTGEDGLAEEYLWREIELGGNVSAATGNLVDLYLKTSDYKKMGKLEENPVTAPYLGSAVQRWLVFDQARVGDYLRMIVIDPLVGIPPEAWLSALLICAMWFIYLWRVDVFEQEPLLLGVVVLLMGAASAEFSLMGGDIMFQMVPVLGGSGGWNDLVYSILHIGLVEEIAKFLPVIILMAFFRAVNEPFDLIIYGSLSALGFATLENALYFKGYGVGIVFPRFIMSTVIHLAMTSLICYAWAWALYYRKKYHLLAVVFGLLLATLAHGLFDYFLLTPDSGLSSFSFLILVGLAAGYGRMIAETLLASPFFDRQRSIRHRLVNYELLICTAIILLVVAFLYNNATFSTSIAIDRMLAMASSSFLMIMIVFGSLGEIGLLRGKAKTEAAG
jgi:RsiW-degrading membrane proteinase PrsW (M82 family)